MADSAKDTWFGFLLGAVIGSGGILGYFYLDKRSQLAVDKDFVTLISDMYQKHSERKDLTIVAMLEEVILPIYEGDDRYKKIVIKLISNFTTRVSNNDEVLMKDTASSTPPGTIKALTEENLIRPGDSVAEIQENFSGNLRKQFSDKLVLSINSGSQNEIDRLIDSILPKNQPYAYRINLYIAFTLARVESWSASMQQKQKFDKLKDFDSSKGGTGFNDPQFNLRVKQADEKYRPAKS